MDTTVVTGPAYGTVEYFAELLRSNAARHDSARHDGALREALLMGSVLGPIQSITRDAGHLGDARAIELIRNVFAAEALVRSELAEAQP